MADTAQEEGCHDCLGTGIGWNGPGSHCRECGGRGYHLRPETAPRDEDRWAWNHFAADPGEDDNMDFAA
jgi:hypothetical protein